MPLFYTNDLPRNIDIIQTLPLRIHVLAVEIQRQDDDREPKIEMKAQVCGAIDQFTLLLVTACVSTIKRLVQNSEIKSYYAKNTCI